MRKIKVFLVLMIYFLLPWQSVTAQDSKDYGKSMAVIFRIEGLNKIIQDVSIYKKNIFEGKAKNIYSQGSVHSTSAVHVKIFSDNRELLLDAYVDNPLDLILESFNDDGSIEQTFLEKEEGFVNIRFPLPAHSTSLSIHSYQIDSNGSEQFINTLEIPYDAK